MVINEGNFNFDSIETALVYNYGNDFRACKESMKFTNKIIIELLGDNNPPII